MTDDVREELLALERRGWDALCGTTGAEVYGELMTPDGLMVLAGGMVMDRDEVVAALRQSPPWGRYEIADARVVPAGEEAAALVYTGRGWRSGEEVPFTAAMTSTYVRTPEGWRLALYTQTPLG